MFSKKKESAAAFREANNKFCACPASFHPIHPIFQTNPTPPQTKS